MADLELRRTSHWPQARGRSAPPCKYCNKYASLLILYCELQAGEYPAQRLSSGSPKVQRSCQVPTLHKYSTYGDLVLFPLASLSTPAAGCRGRSDGKMGTWWNIKLRRIVLKLQSPGHTKGASVGSRNPHSDIASQEPASATG